ncbi:MAG: LD-carboxypeptidase [Muribaculaceae bacterium]
MEQIIFPSPLNKGDKIAIISPASHILPEYVDGACQTITQLGFQPVVSTHCKGQCGGYSGTIEQRLADFLEALHNPEVKAILCSRGGYGVVHLLEYLSSDDIAKNAKWLIGFSDISALHAAMVASGVASIHASMAKHLTQFDVDNEATQALFNILQGKLPTYQTPSHPFNKPGTATGTLTGGNMAVLCGLLDTEFDLLSRGDILFIEDVGEEVYKIERMLYNLRLSGVLPMIKGLIVGRFTDYRNPDGNGDSMEQMVKRMVEPYDIPVAFDFPVGHVDENMPLIEGAQVTLTVADTVTLQFHA